MFSLITRTAGHAREAVSAPFEILAPLGGTVVLLGAAASAAMAADGENYRFGIASKATGKVPLFGDLRMIAIPVAYLGSMGAQAAGLGRTASGMRLLGFAALVSLGVTEGIRAKETGNLWGLELSKVKGWLGQVPLVGRLTAPKPQSETSGEEPAAVAAGMTEIPAA